MNVNINIIRGDTAKFKFQRRDKNNEIITTLPEKLYFTVKVDYSTEKYVLQKSLGNGIEVDEDNWYHVTVQPEDTANLPYHQYVYDIEVVTEEYTKTVAKGYLLLSEEVTFKGNEG